MNAQNLRAGQYSIFFAKGLTYFPIGVRFCQFLTTRLFMLNFAHQEYVPSYYFDSRNQDFQLPALTQTEHADVCVIGAGFFGLSAALELAEKGKKVIVLEGARVGFGASGRSGGQAINGFEEGIDEYIKQVGFEKARKLWEMSLEAIDIIDERIKKYGIQCDWKKGYATLALNERSH